MSVNVLALFWLKEVINHCHAYTAKTEIFVKTCKLLCFPLLLLLFDKRGKDKTGEGAELRFATVVCHLISQK